MILLLPLLFALAFARAPLHGTDYPSRIADEYIVIYNRDISSNVITAHQASLSSNIMWSYNISESYRGFSAHLTEEELNKVLETPFVKEVHCNGLVHLTCNAVQEQCPSWGLARVSHPSEITGALPDRYIHDVSRQGNGVTVYVLDTGVFKGHQEFETGRCLDGASFVPGEPDGFVDQNGHGTHCAGTAAGNEHGIARHSRIYPIKVLGRTGSGSFAGVVAGIQHCADEHAKNGGPSVASMSLGATTDGGMNGAVEGAIARGISFCVAAGNNNDDACGFYPASAIGAITVGSSDQGGVEEHSDIRSPFSNYGKCVEIFAPGSTITSCYIPNRNSYATLSGTSMACPHAAGVVALILGENPRLSPAEVSNQLVGTAHTGSIIDLDPESPNKLLYNGCRV